MENSEIKILFLGTPEFALPTLLRLVADGYQVVGVVTQVDKASGRGNKLIPSPVKVAALEKKLPIFQFAKINAEAIAEIKKLAPDLMVLVAYGKILPEEFLNLSRFGCLNLHPSLLPAYRGPAPVQTALLNGEAKTGVSIIKLDAEVDHGPIVAQKSFEILDDDDSQSLGNNLACEGAALFSQILPDYLAGRIAPQAQDDTLATYTKMFTKADGEIDWKKTPIEIYSQIRACYPWPGAWTDATGKRVKVLRAHIETANLIIDWVQPEGKEPMRYSDYLNGNEPLPIEN
ncbi:MAG: methionyl-tRNA formyltransferase [Patescibacteria group bacterium]|jgi:methionyl-tRNA formyltransferase